MSEVYTRCRKRDRGVLLPVLALAYDVSVAGFGGTRYNLKDTRKRAPRISELAISMNNNEKEMVARLEAMSLDQARREVASGVFGSVGSLNHAFCSSWLAAKEAALRDALATEANNISKKSILLSKIAIWVSIVAALIALGALLKDVLSGGELPETSRHGSTKQ